MSDVTDPADWLPAVVALAEEAGRKIMEVYARGFDIEQKQDRSPLTEADMAAHHVINAGLNRLAPGVPVLSEEAADIPYATRALWRRYWLVDPLDGTREFIKRNGEFTVNIALIIDHQPVLGVIYVPVSGVGYYASAGRGAYRTRRAKRRGRSKCGRGMAAGSRWPAAVPIATKVSTVFSRNSPTMKSSPWAVRSSPVWWRKAKRIFIRGWVRPPSGTPPPRSA